MIERTSINDDEQMSHDPRFVLLQAIKTFVFLVTVNLKPQTADDAISYI